LSPIISGVSLPGFFGAYLEDKKGDIFLREHKYLKIQRVHLSTFAEKSSSS
jgi:hypothetical protein